MSRCVVGNVLRIESTTVQARSGRFYLMLLTGYPFASSHPYWYKAPVSVSRIDVRTDFYVLIFIRYSRSIIRIPADTDNPFDPKCRCRSCQSLSEIRMFRMGIGPGGSGSDFLGIPVVSSNSDHWVFSEGLLRAITFGLNGVCQGV